MADTTENEIGLAGKITAGILLIGAMVLVIYNITAYWPDRMPAITQGDNGAWYHNERFHIALIDSCDSTKKKETTVADKSDTAKVNDSLKKDNARLEALINEGSADTAKVNKWKEAITINTKKLAQQSLNTASVNEKTVADKLPCQYPCDCENRIHLNTLLLILVALIGILGNLIYITTSFTTYVGNGTFKQSWVLWYFVKPFTAAALAIVVYIVIRAGFLSYGSGGAAVNLYGVAALAALAGLSTDKATEKLREIFAAIFTTKEDNRKDKLQGDVSAADVSPNSIDALAEATLTITGKLLDTPGIKVTIDGNAITPVSVTADKIIIKYKPTPEATTAKKAALLVTDKDNKTLLKKDIAIK